MRLVFDAKSWEKVGDQGDNSQFWKPATVLKLYPKDGDVLIDVMFGDGTISKGHFWNATKSLDAEYASTGGEQ